VKGETAAWKMGCGENLGGRNAFLEAFPEHIRAVGKVFQPTSPVGGAAVQRKGSGFRENTGTSLDAESVRWLSESRADWRYGGGRWSRVVGEESAATLVFLADFPTGSLVAVGRDQLVRQTDQQGRSFQLAKSFVFAQMGGDIPPSQEVKYDTCSMDFLAVGPHKVQIIIAEVALLAALPSVSAHLDHGFPVLFED
jgi:hypothetical protein